ncbi:unnamed protein product [Citrullus colocynthis]|uniref:Uncharacterized protein n=1 Tax=Citrullus colocynthis TaxID=252529 RepID=A0ABP0XLG3_9ROSI
MAESWMNQLGKWKNRVEAQRKKKPSMSKSNQLLPPTHLKQTTNSDSDDTETTTLSESTICLLMDRFAPIIRLPLFFSVCNYNLLFSTATTTPAARALRPRVSEVDVRMQIADFITNGLRVVDVDSNSNFDHRRGRGR